MSIINCGTADPLGADMQLQVYVRDGSMECNEDGCGCNGEGSVIDLPGRRVTIAEILEAVKEHREKYSQ